MTGSRVRRHATAVTRGVGLLALAGIGLVALALVVAALVPGFGLGLVFLLPRPILTARVVPRLARRLAGDWSGVPIADPYRPQPLPPVRGFDGMYVRDQQLYRRSWWPRMADRIDWTLGDEATWRDLLWLMVNPLVGGVLAGLPAGLVVAGGWLTVIGIWPAPVGTRDWLTVGLGLLLVVAGFAVAPAMVTAHGHWTRLLLRPVQPHPGRVRRWYARFLVTILKIAALLGLTVLSVVAAALGAVAVLTTYLLGWFFTLPPAVLVGRRLADLRRRLAREWSAVEIERPYQREPGPPVRRPDGFYQVRQQLYRKPGWAAYHLRWRWLATDPATWRDLAWLATDPLVGGALLVAPLATIWYGFWGLTVNGVLAVARVPDAGGWTGAVAGSATLAVPVGLALTALGAALAPVALRLHGRWTALLLAPTARARLHLRLRRLTESRADATRGQADELRRIERDLHDGAQARLVAVGLTLAAVESLLDRDPAAARELLAEARAGAAKALQELRDLVRGIHPPVLAERGLGDAIRALALDGPLPAEVTVDLPGRQPPEVESAVYFAVAELLANVGKHARAGRVRIDVRHDGRALTVAVRDDGRGGADPAAGSGLRGIARRLGTLDGALRVDSPAGGPTTIIVEVPCASSSPRISTC